MCSRLPFHLGAHHKLAKMFGEAARRWCQYPVGEAPAPSPTPPTTRRQYPLGEAPGVQRRCQTLVVRRPLASAMKLHMPLPLYTNMSPFSLCLDCSTSPWLSMFVTCQHSSGKRMHMCIAD